MKKKTAITKKLLVLLIFILGTFSNHLLAANPDVVYTDERQQEVEVSGTVTDAETGDPLPGVNIVVRGTTTGTTTDMDGNYSFEVPADATLVFSFVGYQRRSIQVEGRREIDLQLQPTVTELEEVVAIGYGTQTVGKVTGSIGSVDADELQKGISLNVDDKLKGKASGVQISQITGRPGGMSRVRIRGVTSISASSNPLYVVDGMPVSSDPTFSGPRGAPGKNPMNSLSPSDIKSIEILKGASATAIYGSRGANGVILITTKQGEEGPVRVNYSTQMGIREATKKIDVMNAQEYMQVMNELDRAVGQEPKFTESRIAEINERGGWDWQEELFRQAMVQKHSISVSGGDQNTNYYASVNFHDEEGMIINSKMQSLNPRINLEQSVEDRFIFGVNLNTSFENNDYVPTAGWGQGWQSGVITAALEMEPTLTKEKDPDGGYPRASYNQVHPLNLAYGFKNWDKTNRIFGNVYGEYEIFPTFLARVKFGTDQRIGKYDSYNSTLTYNGEAVSGDAAISDSWRSHNLYEMTLNYNESFGEHEVEFMGGTTYEKFVNEYNSSSITGFPSDYTETFNLGLGNGDRDDVNSNYGAHTLLSYIGRINYSFANKYLLTGSFRADGSSRFGEDNKYGFFPSAAIGWRLINEDFIAQLGLFSNLKLRLSWGVTGNQEIGNYNALATYGSMGNATINNQNIKTLGPTRIPNTGLKWEETQTFNAGVDMGFFNGRLTGSFDYFVKDTKNMLMNLPLPNISGFGSFLDNVGSMRNQGIELSIESENLSGSDFTWNTSLNFSRIKNEVTDLGPVENIIHGGLAFTHQIAIIRKGSPINCYYGHEVTGIWQEGDDIENSAQPNAEPGYLKFRDVNNDKQINEKDKMILGNPFPDYTFGFTNTFGYKNFELEVFLEGSQGNEIISNDVIRTYYPGSHYRNRLSEPLLNRWTPDNPTNKYPSFTTTNYGGSIINSKTVLDASYIRLSNIQLSYNIPLENVEFIRSANVNFSIQNVFTWTDYPAYNPEANALGNNNIQIDWGTYPLGRLYSLGINLAF
jgi:TonB-linked SusC/RagA family outer membrane protein